MKRIPLTKGKFALVDDCDYKYLIQWNWHLAKGHKYAARSARRTDNTIKHSFYMHQIIASHIGLNVGRIDHKDRNGLNNRRKNLRPASNQFNLANRGPQVNNTSGYKGVTWDKERNRWLAQIKVNQKNKYLGRYDDIIKAARAYDKAAIKYFGEFAYLNFPIRKLKCTTNKS